MGCPAVWARTGPLWPQDWSPPTIIRDSLTDCSQRLSAVLKGNNSFDLIALQTKSEKTHTINTCGKHSWLEVLGETFAQWNNYNHPHMLGCVGRNTTACVGRLLWGWCWTAVGFQRNRTQMGGRLIRKGKNAKCSEYLVKQTTLHLYIMYSKSSGII